MTEKRPLVKITRMAPPATPFPSIPGLLAWFDVEVAEVVTIYGCALAKTKAGFKVRFPKSDQRDSGRPGGRHVLFSSGPARHHVQALAEAKWQAINE